MSEVSKVEFVSFTQHVIQGNITHVKGVKGVLYSVYRGLSPLQVGKLFEKPSIFWV